jgi:hypothetical protein
MDETSQPSQSSQQQAGDGAAGNPGKKKGRPPAFPCLCCGENCAKSQHAVRCIMCTLWAHKDCLKMPDNIFKALDDQVKESGTAYWVCRPCQSFGQRVQHQFAESNKRHDMAEKRLDAAAKRIDGTEKRMDDLEDQLRRVTEKMSREGNDKEDRLCDEMQEREVRRMNLIIHGVEEQPDGLKGNRERIEGDKTRCELIFKAMRAKTRKDDLRFCRRIGEKRNEARPIVIGLESEEEKRHILNRARDLRGTQYCDISIVPDLTKKQRDREARMKVEADEKNKDLTAEEKRRNVKWMVVGRRGEKRLIKGVERDQQNYGDDNRARERNNDDMNRNQRTMDENRARERNNDDRNRNQWPALDRPATNNQQPATTSGPELLPARKNDDRWQPQTRDERELGARSKNAEKRPENRGAGVQDRQEKRNRWGEVVTRERVTSKRTRRSGTTSEEDDLPRTRQRN